MEKIYEYMWIVPLIIGVVAVIKVIKQVVKNSHNREHDSTNHNAVTQVHDSVPAITPLNEVGPFIYYANDNHNLKDNEYKFLYKKVSDSWRAYIVKMPSLKNRDPAGNITHRHFDNGQPYVCWDTPVQSLNDMQIITRVWADSIQGYIATGKRFG